MGSSLLEIAPSLNLLHNYPFVSAKVNNVEQGLKYRVYANRDVEYLDVTDPSGMRAYVRSLCFVLYKAVRDLFPQGNLLIEHSISRGLFCTLELGRELQDADAQAIRSHMTEIIHANLPFHRKECPVEEAIQIFTQQGLLDKVRLLQTTHSLYTFYYLLGDTADYYYGPLVPSTGFLKVFDLIKYHDGLLLRLPSKENPNTLEQKEKQEKMMDVFKEDLRWCKVMGLENIADINLACEQGRASELIQVAEAIQEKKIVQIANDICNRPKVKVVLISGPSSSGKTTFSKRLAVQLMANGLRPQPISIDNYFVNRVDTPLDEHGQYDFECLQAVDIKLFNEQLEALLRGEEVVVPTYNFTIGEKEFHDKMKIDDKTILILEGIHGLNPELTPSIPAESKYRIYVSALTAISVDNHNRISTTDNRLLRRIVRDYNYRGFSAQDTIRRCPSVTAGEEKWIFPFQERADATFNSSLLFELSVLRPYAEFILNMVPENCPEYLEAHRLLQFIHNVTALKDNELPPTSLLREFLGGSSFKY